MLVMQALLGQSSAFRLRYCHVAPGVESMQPLYRGRHYLNGLIRSYPAAFSGSSHAPVNIHDVVDAHSKEDVRSLTEIHETLGRYPTGIHHFLSLVKALLLRGCVLMVDAHKRGCEFHMRHRPAAIGENSTWVG